MIGRCNQGGRQLGRSCAPALPIFNYGSPGRASGSRLRASAVAACHPDIAAIAMTAIHPTMIRADTAPMAILAFSLSV